MTALIERPEPDRGSKPRAWHADDNCLRFVLPLLLGLVAIGAAIS